jgi:mono/diheme cytochrome c family protein
MRWTRSLSLVLVIAAAVTAATALAASQSAKATPSRADMLKRGKYLMTAMPCVDCHTPGTFYGSPDVTRMYSGSEVGWVGPWGVVYARNLTPDNETGLGKWTEEQIVTAIRTGNRPDGRQLAPIMPWMSFANLTHADALAMAMYLKTIPAISHKVPEPVPPGQQPTGALVAFPPPPAWDAMNLPKPPADAAAQQATPDKK